MPGSIDRVDEGIASDFGGFYEVNFFQNGVMVVRGLTSKTVPEEQYPEFVQQVEAAGFTLSNTVKLELAKLIRLDDWYIKNQLGL